MQRIRSSVLTLLILGLAGFTHTAAAQRCVMGLDANGNPNGACRDWDSSSGSYDSRSYDDPSNGKNTNFIQSLFQFPMRALRELSLRRSAPCTQFKETTGVALGVISKA